MITGFEEYTKELSDYERDKLLPAIVSGMRDKVGSKKAISSSAACKKMRERGFQITTPRFRKIMHVIRVSGMIKGIVGTSKGYYIASNDKEWKAYVKSITERCNHMVSIRNALASQYEDYKTTML